MDLQERAIDTKETGLASDVTAVVSLIPRMLRGRSLEDGLSLVVTVEGNGLQAKCQYIIKADSETARDRMKNNVMTSEPGWTCRNTTKTTAVCDHD